MNALLIEEHPLLRLGLLQMLENMREAAEATAVAPSEIGQLDSRHHNADLMIFGMPVDTAAGWAQLEEARTHLAPQRILVLADALPLHAPTAESARGLCGCLPKAASLPVIEAAIRLAVSGVQSLVFTSDATTPAASRSAMPAATASLASAVPLPLPASAPADHMLAACATAPRAPLGAALRGAVTAVQPHPQAIQSAHASTVAQTEDGEPSYDEAEMLKITPRQYEVLVLLARGYPIKTVSRMLNISVATVKSHACTLYQRLKVRNKGEAVYAALQRGATLEWVSGDDRLARDTRRMEPARPAARHLEAGYPTSATV